MLSGLDILFPSTLLRLGLGYKSKTCLQCSGFSRQNGLCPREYMGLIGIVNEEGIIIIIILNNDILPVLGLNSGYTVKYSPPPSGVPSDFALKNSLRCRAIFDRIYLVSS